MVWKQRGGTIQKLRNNVYAKNPPTAIHAIWEPRITQNIQLFKGHSSILPFVSYYEDQVFHLI